MEYLAFKVGDTTINAPAGIPRGGLEAIEVYLRNAMLVFLFFGISLSVIYMVWGALQWIQSQGDKQKLTSAKSKVTWAIIGLIILFLSYAFVGAIGFLFRVNLLKLTP